jgi:hypothetical protein
MKALINVDDILKSYGMDRDIIIEKNPEYKDVFQKLDKYYDKYKQSPTESLLNATNNISMMVIDKIKAENPEMFMVEEKLYEKEEVVEDKFSKYKEQLLFYMDEGDQNAIDDLFNEVGEKNARYLLTYENFKAFNIALRSKKNLVINYLKEMGYKYNIYPDMVLGRDGENLNLIIATKNTDLIAESLNVVRDKDETKEIVEKNRIEQQIIEMGDENLTEIIDDILEKESIEKAEESSLEETIEKVEDAQKEEKKAAPKQREKRMSKTLKEQTPLKQIMDMLNSGQIAMDTPLVIKLEKKFSIKVLDTPEDIAVGKNDTYKFIVPTGVSDYFDANKLLADENYTLYEAKKTMFEKQFGLSVYELGICWFNLINMVSVDDIIALFYIANISTVLMVDRNNQSLRNDYLNNLRVALQNPEANKISGRYFQLKEANLINLKQSGFLDEQLCPTKLLYAAIVLHSFPFPAFTHPFEFVKIDNLSSMFQFQTIKGEFGNETFYTDGDVLFLNYSDTSVSNYAQSLTDVARTIILNIKSNGKSDITKQKTAINHFIPVIYTVPKSGISIPTFNIRVLDMDNRKINWGVYEVTDNNNKVFINSYGLSNLLNGANSKEYELMKYEGKLSEYLFSNPTQGVLVQTGNSFLAIRGLKPNMFLSENYGKNWEKYYAEMYGKNYLNNEVLDKLDPDMVKAIYTSTNNLVVTTETGLQYKIEKTYEDTYEKGAIKPPPQIKKIVVPVAKKDDRVYISKAFSRDKLDKSLWDVFDAVYNLAGEIRDEAILDEMYRRNIDRIFPNQLVYLGFGLKEYVIDKPERIRFKNKYKLTIPILLSYQPTYYLEKI